MLEEVSLASTVASTLICIDWPLASSAQLPFWERAALAMLQPVPVGTSV